jgi:hypothetical protein
MREWGRLFLRQSSLWDAGVCFNRIVISLSLFFLFSHPFPYFHFYLLALSLSVPFISFCFSHRLASTMGIPIPVIEVDAGRGKKTHKT